MLAARLRSHDGFTLTEMLISMAVIGLILGGMLTLLLVGQETYLTGSNQVAAQESGRIGLQRVIAEIRGAGTDPTGALNATAPLWTRITSASTTAFTIQNDWGGDGSITSTTTVNVNGTLRGEQVLYQLSGTTLQRREFGIDATPQIVIDGVDALTFTYFDVNNAAIGNPGANASLIRTIGITLRTRPPNQNVNTQGRTWVTMDDRVRIRN
jgi:prepilin-type N-terminal cleavage/methylation domain-containing protein